MQMDSCMEIWTQNAHRCHSSPLWLFKMHSEQCTINILSVWPSDKPSHPTSRLTSHSQQKWPQFHRLYPCSWASSLSGWDPGETTYIPRHWSINFNNIKNPQLIGSYTQRDCKGSSRTRRAIEGYLANWYGSVWPPTACFHWRSRSWWSHKHLKEPGLGTMGVGMCMQNKLSAWAEILCFACTWSWWYTCIGYLQRIDQPGRIYWLSVWSLGEFIYTLGMILQLILIDRLHNWIHSQWSEVLLWWTTAQFITIRTLELSSSKNVVRNSNISFVKQCANTS